MMIRGYGRQLQKLVPTISCNAPHQTVLGEAGTIVHTMVCAYLEDGTLCLKQGDPINALASFGYAQGWLEGGIFLGLVSSLPVTDVPVIEDPLDASLLPRLQEKVQRYHRLLSEGITAVEPAPDEASILWKGAGELLNQARWAHQRGEERYSTDNLQDALRWFGYGHGWLDTGVRTGLYRITGRRNLFTI